MTYNAFDQWRREAVGSEPALSVVIPAYNETRRIVPTIASIAAHLAEHGISWELIVADDGSTDGMCDTLRALELVNMRIVGSGRNEGKGAAVRRGLAAARGRSVLFTDADMSTPIDQLDEMLHRLDAGADIVVGSRASDGATVSAKSKLRALLSWVLQLIVSTALPTKVRDTQCGFKLFRREVAHELARVQTIDGFSFDLELLFVARKWGLRVDEVGVHWVDAPGSTVDPAREAIRFLRDIVKIRIRSLRGAYRRSTARSSDTFHVAVVTPYPPSTRTLNEYGTHLVAGLLQKPEITTLSVYHDETDLGPATVPDGVRAVPTWRFGSLSNTFRIVRTVRRERPDAVFFNLQFATFGDGRVAAALGLLAPALVRLAGVPSVVLLHNLVDTVDLQQAGFTKNPLMGRLYLAIGRMLTRVVLAATKVGVTLPAYVEILQRRYGATNVYLAPHGTFDIATDDVSLCDGPRQVLAFGKFGTYKRVDPLVAAYRLLIEAGYEDLELVIGGTDAANAPGYLAEIQAQNADLPGLRFTGYVAESDVEQLFRRATVVAFPYTATTGSSGPLHQAGSFGRAVVLPAIGDFLEIIGDEGFTGETFEPDDEMSLAGAIARLLDDDVRREQIARQNAEAAGSLQLVDVVDWHVLHLLHAA
jgi:glycosyltransferase involved in cell wall biosynthesis